VAWSARHRAIPSRTAPASQTTPAAASVRPSASAAGMAKVCSATALHRVMRSSGPMATRAQAMEASRRSVSSWARRRSASARLLRMAAAASAASSSMSSVARAPKRCRRAKRNDSTPWMRRPAISGISAAERMCWAAADSLLVQRGSAATSGMYWGACER
jgi:hypothetical protein